MCETSRGSPRAPKAACISFCVEGRSQKSFFSVVMILLLVAGIGPSNVAGQPPPTPTANCNISAWESSCSNASSSSSTSAGQQQCWTSGCVINKSIAATAAARAAGGGNQDNAAVLSSCVPFATLSAVVSSCNTAAVSSSCIGPSSSSSSASSASSASSCLNSLSCRLSVSSMCSADCFAASLRCLVADGALSSGGASNNCTTVPLLSQACRWMLWQDVALCSSNCSSTNLSSSCSATATTLASQCDAASSTLITSYYASLQMDHSNGLELSPTTVYIIGAGCAAAVAAIVGLSIICIVRLRQAKKQSLRNSHNNSNGSSPSTARTEPHQQYHRGNKKKNGGGGGGGVKKHRKKKNSTRGGRADDHSSCSSSISADDSDSAGIHTPPPIWRGRGGDGGGDGPTQAFASVSPADRSLDNWGGAAGAGGGAFSFGHLLGDRGGGDWEDPRAAPPHATSAVHRFVSDDDEDNGYPHESGGSGGNAYLSLSRQFHTAPPPAAAAAGGDFYHPSAIPDTLPHGLGAATLFSNTSLEWRESHWQQPRKPLGQFESPAKSSPSKGIGCYAVSDHALYSDEDAGADDQLRVNPFEDDGDQSDVGDDDNVDGCNRRGIDEGMQQQGGRPLSNQQPQGSMSLGELEFAFTERSQSSRGTDIAPPGAAGGGPSSRPGSEGDVLSRKGSSKASRRNNSASSRGSRRASHAAADPQFKDVIRQIKAGDFRRGRLLGRGATGSVYQTIFPSGLILACKEVDVKQRTSDEITKMARFFDMFTKLQHPHIIQCYAVTYDAESHSLLQWMELVKGGSLHRLARKASGIESRAATPISKSAPSSPSLLHDDVGADDTDDDDKKRKKRNGSEGNNNNSGMIPSDGLDEAVVAEYAKQILSALAQMHAKGIVHRDIKGSNVLLTDDRRHARIIDFDSATLVASSSSSSSSPCGSPKNSAVSTSAGGGGGVEGNPNPPSVVGTPLWMAPEIITGKGGCTTAADIWSFGITVAELIDGGNPPWPIFENTWSAMLHLASTNARPTMPFGVSSELRLFLQRCWEPEPQKRADAAELLEHPWLLCRSGSPALLARSASRDASVANSEVLSVASSSGAGLGVPSSVGNLSSLGRGGMGHHFGGDAGEMIGF